MKAREHNYEGSSKSFVGRAIEGFEQDLSLPLDVKEYLHFLWIRRTLYGPNGNLASSWSGFAESFIYNGAAHGRTVR